MDSKSVGILGTSIIAAAFVIAVIRFPQLGPQVGRFQLNGIPGHAYVIDTATGKVWEDFAPAGQGTSDSEFKNPKIK